MKTSLIPAGLVVVIICALALATTAFGQLQFTGISATPEGTIQVTWASISNETYEIDEADTLETNAQGTMTWNQLYTEYPSQGSNTFWLDCGNYVSVPSILNPKYTTNRFYRVVDSGPDTTPDEPSVAITNLSSGAVVSDVLTVIVTAISDQSFLTTKLYVDGQEQNEADISTNWTDITGVTNYVIDTYYLNTCEWLNGPHTMFASARCQSGPSGIHDSAPILIGHSVSPFVPVSFSNLITGISFTQPFFCPEDGTTQQVTAVFAANVNWTLDIQDVNTNTVRSATGIGGAMLFDWDGTDNNSNSLPVGLYTYFISVQTNGQPLSGGGGGGGSGGSGPPGADEVSGGSTSGATTDELWAEPPDGAGIAVPRILFPPGFDLNGYRIFEAPASWSPVAESDTANSSDAAADSGGGGIHPDYTGGSSQSSIVPVRPPNKRVLHRVGRYGVAYQTYSANGTNGFLLAAPNNGQGQGPIGLEGHTAARSTFIYPSLPQYVPEVNNFVSQMNGANWTQGFLKPDDQLAINDLRASGANVFTNVNLGLLLLHGTFTSNMDLTENGAQEIYYPITSGTSIQYLRMSEMNLGGSGTNGLKWMGILACNSLRQNQWRSMQSANRSPINGNLHLILGGNSILWTGDHVASYWAKYITLGKNGSAPWQIEAAWYQGARDAYAETKYNYTNAIIFAAAGDAACQTDTLQTNSSPGGTTFYTPNQVWP